MSVPILNDNAHKGTKFYSIKINSGRIEVNATDQ